MKALMIPLALRDPLRNFSYVRPGISYIHSSSTHLHHMKIGRGEAPTRIDSLILQSRTAVHCTVTSRSICHSDFGILKRNALEVKRKLMAYIPPHLRKATAAPPSQVVKVHSPTDRSSEQEMYTIDDIISVFGPSVGSRGTLNAVESNPDTLAYVLLFGDRFSNCNSRGEIFCKTNVHLLHQSQSATRMDDSDAPTVEKRGTERSTAEFPVFLGNGTGRCGKWECLGWHRIANVTYLQPKSAELVKMLDEKFNGEARSSEKWQSSLRMEWAAVALARVKGLEKEDPMGNVVRKPAKGVKELLEEMRSSDTHISSSE